MTNSRRRHARARDNCLPLKQPIAVAANDILKYFLSFFLDKGLSFHLSRQTTPVITINDNRQAKSRQGSRKRHPQSQQTTFLFCLECFIFRMNRINISRRFAWNIQLCFVKNMTMSSAIIVHVVLRVKTRYEKKRVQMGTSKVLVHSVQTDEDLFSSLDNEQRTLRKHAYSNILKFHHQKLKISDKNSNIFFIFLLKT